MDERDTVGDAANNGTTEEVDGLVQLTFAVQEILNRVAAARDLSITQLRLLGILRDRTPTMAMLADRLQLEPSSVSGLIDRAAKRGLVRRVTADHDARVTYVAVTAYGARLSGEATGEVVQQLQALLDRLAPAQRAALATLAATLTATDSGADRP